MRYFKAIFAALLLANTTIAFAQPVYEVHCAPGIIKIDGILDELAWEATPWSDPFVDIRGKEYPAPSMETRFKMLYDERNIYIAAKLIEPNITATLKQHDSIIYHDNDFEVFLDPYGDGQFYYELEVNAYGTVMDLLMTKPYSTGGTFLMNWDCPGLQVKTSLDGTINDKSDTDSCWYVEIAIPLRSLDRVSSKLSACSRWRVNFSRIEWLRTDGHEEDWVWAPTGKVDIHLPQFWGYAEFQY